MDNNLRRFLKINNFSTFVCLLTFLGKYKGNRTGTKTEVISGS